MMMRRRIGSIGQTAIYFHLATLLMIFYLVLMKQTEIMVISFASIFVHEVAHGIVSKLWGYQPQEIEITPMGMLMRLDDECCLPFGKRLAIYLAGPAATLLLCWVSLFLTRGGVLPLDWGRKMFLCNLMLLFCNLIPVLPLDGGRVLALVLAVWFNQTTIKYIMHVAGSVCGIGLIIANFLLSLFMGGWNLSLGMAGCLLMYAAAVGTTSHALAELRMLMDRKIYLEQHGIMKCSWVIITASVTLRKALDCLAPRRYTMYQLVEHAGMKPDCVVPEDVLISAYFEHPGACCSILLNKHAKAMEKP